MHLPLKYFLVVEEQCPDQEPVVPQMPVKVQQSYFSFFGLMVVKFKVRLRNNSNVVKVLAHSGHLGLVTEVVLQLVGQGHRVVHERALVTVV